MSGLVTMTPTSIDHVGTSASINANGGVDFEGVTSLSLDGVFKSGDDGFDNYLIVVQHVLNTSDLTYSMRLRLSGTDAIGTNYTIQRLLALSTDIQGTRTPSSSVGIAGLASSTARSGDHIYVYGPALAQPTAFRNVSASGFQSATIDDYANTHSLSTAYDGFTLAVSSGSMTGNVIVMGYAE